MPATTVPTPVKYVGSGRFFRNPSPEKCYTIFHIGPKIVKYLLIVCIIAGFALIALINVEYLSPNNEGGQVNKKRIPCRVFSMVVFFLFLLLRNQ